MTAPRMLYLGGVLVDLIYRIARLPSPGTEVTADTADVQVGGGFNTMSAASRNGLAVAYGGAHGQGPHGDAARQALRTAEIAALQDVTPNLDNGTCVVLVTDDGERSFVTHAGVESLLTDEQLAAVVPRADDWIVLSVEAE